MHLCVIIENDRIITTLIKLCRFYVTHGGMVRPRPSDVNNDVLYIKCKVDSSILAYIFIHFRYTTS